jgi:hypothetical protein
MLNVFNYYDEPTSLNRADLIPHMDLLKRMHSIISDANAKEILAPVINIIKRSPDFAYMYALYVLKSRWEEAEPYIMHDPNNAYWYTRDVIKERWPDAEPYIKQNETYWSGYKKYFNITD